VDVLWAGRRPHHHCCHCCGGYPTMAICSQLVNLMQGEHHPWLCIALALLVAFTMPGTSLAFFSFLLSMVDVSKQQITREC